MSEKSKPPTFLTVDSSACKLAIIDDDIVARHRFFHSHERVGSNLMTETATSTVHHDTNLPNMVNTHFAGRILVVDLVNNLDFTIVISGAKCPKLNFWGLEVYTKKFGLPVEDRVS